MRKLEELGIGRPSTYAPTISTIQTRGYVEKTDLEGKEREVTELKLENRQGQPPPNQPLSPGPTATNWYPPVLPKS